MFSLRDVNERLWFQKMSSLKELQTHLAQLNLHQARVKRGIQPLDSRSFIRIVIKAVIVGLGNILLSESYRLIVRMIGVGLVKFLQSWREWCVRKLSWSTFLQLKLIYFCHLLAIVSHIRGSYYFLITLQYEVYFDHDSLFFKQTKGTKQHCVHQR